MSQTMASTSTSTATPVIVSPANRSSSVWKHFGLIKGSTGKLDKTKAVCKLCDQKISTGDRMTNLKNHLKSRHASEYGALYSAQERQPSLDGFVSPDVKKWGSHSLQARKVTDAVAQFIVSDIRPVNVVDGLGFLNLMEVAQPLLSAMS